MLAGMRWRCLLCVAAACRPAPPENPEAILRAQTQDLLDAVAAGKREVWDRLLDPGIIYVSEAGELETKASLLAQIDPLPPGVTGSIAVGKLVVHQFGDTAIVTHVDDEHEDYHGQPLRNAYWTTTTWRRGPGGWRLIATQVLAMLQDPPAIELPAAQLDDYAGTYRLTDAITYTIARDGDHLVGTRAGGKPQPLGVELRDLLFVPGQPRSRKLFVRDASGRIIEMRDRREARDVVWTKLP
jgi:hypothetical protein